jgi:hypothetical protein
MGKLARPPAPPQKYPGAKPGRRLSPALLAAVVAGLLLAALLGLAVWRSMQKTQAPLPAATAQQLPPLPPGPPLPAVSQKLPEGPPLPETNIQALPQQPVTTVQPPPRPVQVSGEIRWTWALYPVDPTILQLAMGDKMAGYRFVALGVTIYNGSDAPVVVDGNAFALTVDGRTYSSEIWSTGAASFIHGMPYLAEATLQPGASMSGCTGFMVPMQSTSALPDWRPTVPATIRVVRMDPQSAQPLPPAPTATPIE